MLSPFSIQEFIKAISLKIQRQRWFSMLPELSWDWNWCLNERMIPEEGMNFSGSLKQCLKQAAVSSLPLLLLLCFDCCSHFDSPTRFERRRIQRSSLTPLFILRFVSIIFSIWYTRKPSRCPTKTSTTLTSTTTISMNTGTFCLERRWWLCLLLTFFRHLCDDVVNNVLVIGSPTSFYCMTGTLFFPRTLQNLSQRLIWCQRMNGGAWESNSLRDGSIT